VDVGAVHAYAEGFSGAVVIDDRDLIATYLREPLEGDFTIILDALSGPLKESEILAVNPLGPSDFSCSEPDEYVSLTRFSGLQEEVLLRAIWSESPHQLLMRKAQVVERKARPFSEPGSMSSDEPTNESTSPTSGSRRLQTTLPS
jgi:hypothetical protein